MSVKVSAAMKIAKTIQYIIHRTCGTQSTEVSLRACGANTTPGWPSPEIPESLSRCIAAFPRAWLGRSLCEAAAHSCAHPSAFHPLALPQPPRGLSSFHTPSPGPFPPSPLHSGCATLVCPGRSGRTAQTLHISTSPATPSSPS